MIRTILVTNCPWPPIILRSLAPIVSKIGENLWVNYANNLTSRSRTRSKIATEKTSEKQWVLSKRNEGGCENFRFRDFAKFPTNFEKYEIEIFRVITHPLSHTRTSHHSRWLTPHRSPLSPRHLPLFTHPSSLSPHHSPFITYPPSFTPYVYPITHHHSTLITCCNIFHFKQINVHFLLYVNFFSFSEYR